MSNSRNNRLTALIVTVIFHALIVVLLLCVFMKFSPSEDTTQTWPPVDSAEVLFGGEFVMIGDNPELAMSSSEAAPENTAAEESVAPTEAEALENAGSPAPPAPVITSERPSPAKTEAKTAPAQTGPSKAELEAAEKAKREQEARNAIANRVTFNNNGTGGHGEGKAGSPDGNSTTGAVSGTPGYNLNGRTLASWKTPAKGPLGSITVNVSVNRQGVVTSATYSRGTGAAAASQSARQSCINAAMNSRFSVSNDAPASQKGTITYNFR